MTADAAPETPQGLGRLLALQELDLSMDRLRHRLEEIESGEEIRAARRRAEELEDQVGELRLALDSVGREQTRLENEIESFSRRIDTEEKRLYDGSVANPKELQSIRAEIENLKNRRMRSEDELLDQMERRENLERRLAPLDVELEEARRRVGEVEARAGEELDDLRAGLGSRDTERAAAVQGLDEEVLELYEDLRATKKGIGAAAVVDRVCMACRQQLSALEFDQLRRETRIRRCPNCRRILVFT